MRQGDSHEVETKSFQLLECCLGYKAKRLRLLASGVSKALFACCVWAYHDSSGLSFVIQIDDSWLTVLSRITLVLATLTQLMGHSPLTT